MPSISGYQIFQKGCNKLALAARTGVKEILFCTLSKVLKMGEVVGLFDGKNRLGGQQPIATMQCGHAATVTR